MYNIIYSIGALTSISSKYNYRMWECDKIEFYDPFDASGLSITFNIFNNCIIKIGPIVNILSSWCTDKVRNFTDVFKSYEL